MDSQPLGPLYYTNLQFLCVQKKKNCQREGLLMRWSLLYLLIQVSHGMDLLHFILRRWQGVQVKRARAPRLSISSSMVPWHTEAGQTRLILACQIHEWRGRAKKWAIIPEGLSHSSPGFRSTDGVGNPGCISAVIRMLDGNASTVPSGRNPAADGGAERGLLIKIISISMISVITLAVPIYLIFPGLRSRPRPSAALAPPCFSC